MHPKTKYKTKELTKLTLQIIGAGLMTYASLGSAQNFLFKSERILKAFGDYSASRVRETVNRLRAQDLVKYNEQDSKSPIILTKKGMKRLARYNLKDILKNLFKSKKKWDHFWRIIFFDIPENKKHIREMLRKELIATGFYPFQKSVYVCPFDCEKQIEEFCRIYGISGKVLFCITPSLGPKEDEVRDFFFRRG